MTAVIWLANNCHPKLHDHHSPSRGRWSTAFRRDGVVGDFMPISLQCFNRLVNQTMHWKLMGWVKEAERKVGNVTIMEHKITLNQLGPRWLDDSYNETRYAVAVHPIKTGNDRHKNSPSAIFPEFWCHVTLIQVIYAFHLNKNLRGWHVSEGRARPVWRALGPSMTNYVFFAPPTQSNFFARWLSPSLQFLNNLLPPFLLQFAT